MGDISKLLDIMQTLRTPGVGCPWDIAQSFATIAPYTIEEAYEVADAIERGALDELEDELGDLLFQVVFHSQMAAEREAFTFAGVVARSSDKLVRRHPHVFGDEPSVDAEAQTLAWEAIKRDEREERSGAGEGVLAGVPAGLPGLTRAAKLGRRAAGVGFDWPEVLPVRAKVAEELAELDEACAAGARERVEAEMGDVFFALANLCRHLDVDPESCVRGANGRFERRFAHVEAAVAASARPWGSFDLPELDALWEEAKTGEAP